LLLASIMLGAGFISACSGADQQPTSGPSTPSPRASELPIFRVASTDLRSGGWPADETCDGGEAVPDLHWTSGPSGTRAYALQLFDPDAPSGGFTHWMLANEPSDLRQPTPGTGVSGRNDFGREGYSGPCPPKGSTHHYVFTVYALDSALSLSPLYRHADFQRALVGHVLAQATLTATYSR
jgi:Raf kinase inhibitor-like YbhB/YbcL family protein